jgi:Probable cobalt transporter subunit (CbtB)
VGDLFTHLIVLRLFALLQSVNGNLLVFGMKICATKLTNRPYLCWINHTILYILTISIILRMSLSQDQRTIHRRQVPIIGVGILAGIALFSLFAVGYDTGQIFSLVQGKSAYDNMWLHEFVHDIRHESGFPCH